MSKKESCDIAAKGAYGGIATVQQILFVFCKHKTCMLVFRKIEAMMAMTTAVTNDLDAKYATLQKQKRNPRRTSLQQTPTHRSKNEDDGGDVGSKAF